MAVSRVVWGGLTTPILAATELVDKTVGASFEAWVPQDGFCGLLGVPWGRLGGRWSILAASSGHLGGRWWPLGALVSARGRPREDPTGEAS